MESMKLTTFGPVDARSLEQLERCAEAGNAEAAVLCADHHPGYSQPIGGVVAYRDFVSPSGVGYDIACGNKAVRTNIHISSLGSVGSSGPLTQEHLAGQITPDEAQAETPQGVAWSLPRPGITGDLGGPLSEETRAEVGKIMNEIVRRISFGMGRSNDEPVDDAVLDGIRDSPFEPQRGLLDLAAKQLGTVGSGNHYVDLFTDEDGWLWVGVHFGSRGFGHKTASGFLALAQGLPFGEHAKEGEMDSPPVLFPVDSELGQAYIDAMEIAGEYAYAGRNAVCRTVLDILGATSVDEVHNHHNFAWLEDGLWVIRKGATPAYPGERGFVGGSMGDISVILEGVESAEAVSALHSTVHGAGRVMSRTQAAGKWKRDTVTRTAPDGTTYEKKIRVRDASTGLIDWDAVRADLDTRGIVLRGAGADEAPGVYKRLPDVLGYHAGSTRILHTLTPIGVAMAGADVFDPYKD